MTATQPRMTALPETPTADDLPVCVMGLAHTLGRFKQHLQQLTRGNGEWIYDAILFTVVNRGPLRASELADVVQCDPSTVSRQVAALVRDALIERTADPDDGRASLLSVTADGLRRYDRHVESRNKHYAAMLADWSEADRAAFATYLARFVRDFDTYRPTMLDELTSVMAGHRTTPEGQQ